MTCPSASKRRDRRVVRGVACQILGLTTGFCVERSPKTRSGCWPSSGAAISHRRAGRATIKSASLLTACSTSEKPYHCDGSVIRSVGVQLREWEPWNSTTRTRFLSASSCTPSASSRANARRRHQRAPEASLKR